MYCPYLVIKILNAFFGGNLNQTHTPALEAWSLNHWTAREVPACVSNSVRGPADYWQRPEAEVFKQDDKQNPDKIPEITTGVNYPTLRLVWSSSSSFSSEVLLHPLFSSALILL